MFLGIDVGNSHITLGLHDGQRWIQIWRWATRLEATADEYGLRLQHWLAHFGVDPDRLKGVGIVSVVPPLTPVLEAAALNYLPPPVFVFRRVPQHWALTHLDLDYNLAQIGLDRVANAVAAYLRYREKGHVCVVDMGSAITVDAVALTGRFLGGAIAPGVDMMLEALRTRTAVLPRLRLVTGEDLTPDRVSAIGHTTEEAILGGVLHGLAGMVTRLVEHVKAALQDMYRAPVYVVGTGGWMLTLQRWMPVDAVDADLTLEGVRILWMRWRETQ